MRQAGCVTCAPKGCQEGEYTEGAGARKRLLPLECAVKAAVLSHYASQPTPLGWPGGRWYTG